MGPVVLGIVIHGACALFTSMLVPLVLGSNIWPIAGVFWGALTAPPAAGLGALIGWIGSERRRGPLTAVLVGTGLTSAAVIATIIVNTP